MGKHTKLRPEVYIFSREGLSHSQVYWSCVYMNDGFCTRSKTQHRVFVYVCVNLKGRKITFSTSSESWVWIMLKTAASESHSKSHLYSKRCVSPKFASFQPGQKSRLHYQSRSQKRRPMKVASLKQYYPCVSKELALSPCFCKAVQQYTGTSRRPSTSGLKCTHDRLEAIGEV